MIIVTNENITSKQRSKLRSLASTLAPITQIGKGGITDNLLKTLSDALEAHELIKVTILDNQLRVELYHYRINHEPLFLIHH